MKNEDNKIEKELQKKKEELQSLEKQDDIVKKNKEEKKLDPTHFGDWQVNCRTIDF